MIDDPGQDSFEAEIRGISVVHVGNTAGVASTIANEQRRLGIDSTVLVYNEEKYEFGADEIVQVKPESDDISGKVFALHNIKNRVIEIQKRLDSYDVLHFHFRSAIDIANPLLPRGLDLPIWKAQGKRIVMHFHGSDIRWSGVARLYRMFADEILVSTPDLLEWAPDRAHWAPRPIDTASIDPVYPQPNSGDPIRIVHAPSNREIKGTEHLVQAVSDLQSRGYDIELEVVEDTPHNQALEIYQSADIVVDWVNPDFGLYGLFSIESMALGKPVIATLGDVMKERVPDENPILDTKPEDLSDQLVSLVESRDQLRELGKQGREYVESMHDVRSVVEKYNRAYKS
ncbi:glycosyltransferase family 4 protein [Natrinema sp. LN54]|uniref:glycosyltransferase family 4 protein n=1 Tax=Natrinema sp. LN54 TaxID=3458705 RepID=UPI004035450F